MLQALYLTSVGYQSIIQQCAFGKIIVVVINVVHVVDRKCLKHAEN